MSETTDDETGQEPYSFGDAIPVRDVPPGTTLILTGSEFGLAEELAIAMVLAGSPTGDGMVFISNAIRADELLEDCRGLNPAFDTDRLGIVDCTGHSSTAESEGVAIERVSNSGDLTGIGMEFSSLYASLLDGSDARVRTGFVDVSTLMMYADLRTAFRFLHTIEGRTSGSGGLLVLVVNPTTLDDRAVSTIMQLSDGRIDVRGGDGQPELRVSGLAEQSDAWEPFQLGDAE